MLRDQLDRQHWNATHKGSSNLLFHEELNEYGRIQEH